MDEPIYITSEIGRLRTVLLHRPGEELENLTPETLHDLLFDDIPHLKVAQEEHDRFANVLRERGIEVLYLDELAAESLADDAVRRQFVDEMLAGRTSRYARADRILARYGAAPNGTQDYGGRT